MKVILFLMGIIIYGCSCNQVPVNKELSSKKGLFEELEPIIIRQSNIGQEYYLNTKSQEGFAEKRLVYLGAYNSKKEGKLQFLYETSYSGIYKDNLRANSNLVIYKNDIRFGCYYIGGEFQFLPTLENGQLVVRETNTDCNETTYVSFTDSIPKKMFIKCKEKNGQMFGDLYTFVDLTINNGF